MAEVPAFSFHTARDSYVTYLMNDKRAGLYDAKDAVGHKKASTTEGYIRSLPVTRLRQRLGNPFEDW
jgi:integrase